MELLGIAWNCVRAPRFTNVTRDFKGTLDYILYTTDSLVRCATLCHAVLCCAVLHFAMLGTSCWAWAGHAVHALLGCAAPCRPAAGP